MNLVLRNQNPFKFLDKTMDDFLTHPWAGLTGEAGYPALDLRETEKEVIVTAELPGVKKEDIELTVENQILHVKGEKQEEKSGKEGNTTWSERSYGQFSRAVHLPAEVATDKVAANFKAGVLEIRLPKSEQAKLKRIPVQGE